MGYLRARDYQKQIQIQNLDQILNNDLGILAMMNLLAQEEMTSYLIQKYNTAFEFTDTAVFDKAAIYGAADRLDIDFPAFSATATYTVGDGVAVGTAQYLARVNNGPGAFNPSNWGLLGEQYDLSYIKFPYPRFNYLNVYRSGDRVWWDGKVYQALRDTIVPTHEMILQARVYRNIGQPNALPGDSSIGNFNSTNSSQAQWGVGTTYLFPGTSILQLGHIIPIGPWSSVTAYAQYDVVEYTNSTYPTVSNWVLLNPAGSTGAVPGEDIVNWLPLEMVDGDNRSQQMVTLMADIALFHVHSRIAPRNIPELRADRYKQALQWLQNAARGNVTPINLELNQPEIGNRITFGGNIKSINSY